MDSVRNHGAGFPENTGEQLERGEQYVPDYPHQGEPAYYGVLVRYPVTDGFFLYGFWEGWGSPVLVKTPVNESPFNVGWTRVRASMPPACRPDQARASNRRRLDE